MKVNKPESDIEDILAKADFSQDSRIHETIKSRLLDLHAKEQPRRVSRARLGRGLTAAARWAGGIALLAGMVLGLNLILGKLGPITGGPVFTATPEMADLENTSWVLTSLNGSKPLPGSQITVNFSGNEASGSSGCNSYRGKYPPQMGQSTEVRYMVTVQLCQPQELMDQEKAYLEAFWIHADYLVENDLLIIKDKGGKPVLAFRRSSPTPLPKTDLATAEGMVRLWYQKDRPGLNPDVQIPLKELTSDEIWSRMGLQVFQVAQGTFQYDTFLIWHTVVLPMGTGFGGAGVTSMAVSDLDQDGQPELLYTYSFGSGIHQSRLGIYAPALPGSDNGVREADITLRDGDLLLDKLDDQEVHVNAEIAAQPSQPVGQVLLLHQGQQVKLGLRINPDVPVDVLNHFVISAATGLYAAIQPTPLPAVDWQAYENALVEVIGPAGYPMFCEWDLLKSTPQADYVWAACADKTSLNGPAASLPAVVYFDAGGRIQKVAIPGDGSKYATDIHLLFPAELQETILNYEVDPGLFVHIQQRRLDPTIPPLVYLMGELYRP
jgi:heat shock protein HslJ